MLGMQLFDPLEVALRFVEARMIEVVETGCGQPRGFLVGQGRYRVRHRCRGEKCNGEKGDRGESIPNRKKKTRYQETSFRAACTTCSTWGRMMSSRTGE